MKTWFLALNTLGTLALGACTTDDTDAGDDLTSTGQELVDMHADTITSTNATGPQSAVIASTSGVACFLTGVTGNLSASHGSPQIDAGLSYSPARGRLTAQWKIFADQFGSNPTKTWSTCTNANGLTPEVTWHANQGPVVLAPVTANRRCFFTSLASGYESNTYGAFGYHGGFSDEYDEVIINNDGTNWHISGNQSGTAWASARCIDVTEDLGTFINYGEETAESQPMVANSGDRACFMTQVAGQIISSDVSSGPHVEAVAGKLTFIAKGYNGGRMDCVR
jgi:hypothetical protein